jgi:hypothetical protein
MLKVSYAVAMYIVKMDLESKGFYLKDEEVEYSMKVVRKGSGGYSLLNGDAIVFHNCHWQIKKYA